MRHPPRAASSASSIESYWENRARQALGLQAKNMLWAFHAFGVRSMNGFGAVTGTGTTPGDHWHRFNATGADVSRASFSGGNANIILFAAAKKWWIAGHYRLTSATAEAGTHGGIGVGNGSTGETVVVGVRGATSVANFVAWGNNGVAIDSGQALDTTRHTHEFYRNGTTGFYLIDEVLKGSGDAQATANASCVAVAAAAAAVNRSIEFRWIAVAAEME